MVIEAEIENKYIYIFLNFRNHGPRLEFNLGKLGARDLFEAMIGGKLRDGTWRKTDILT